MADQPVGGTLLIAAAAYVGPELAADFGRLPPALLPVGNRRLYAHQHAALGAHFDRILLSIPDDFRFDPHEEAALDALAIQVVRVPGDCDLPTSILHVIAECSIDAGSFGILHGDTLVYDIDYRRTNSVSVALADDLYSWAGCDIVDDQIVNVYPLAANNIGTAPVLSGFFHFDDVQLLVFSLAAARGDFLNALCRYLAKRPLAPLTSDRWLDFGHLHTYYASRGRITTERSFNSLQVGGRKIYKQSDHAHRIDSEANWYESMPADLRLYLPHYLGRNHVDGRDGYQLEFLYLSSLADLFVFGRLPEVVWSRIFKSCDAFLCLAADHRAPPGAALDVMDLYLPKTLARLDEYAASSGIDLDKGWVINGSETPGLRAIAHQSSGWISPPEPRHLSIVHGDPCFSNILYDFRSHSVRVIDPRGQDASGAATIWGDNRYDLAKLHHSAIGCYDLILGGLCSLQENELHVLEFEIPDSVPIASARNAFERVIAPKHARDMASVEAICLHLFLSMLPLHADNPARQKMLLANALRLYVMIVENGAQR